MKNHTYSKFILSTWISLAYAPPVIYQQLAIVAGVLKPETQQFSLAAGRAYLNYAKNL